MCSYTNATKQVYIVHHIILLLLVLCQSSRVAGMVLNHDIIIPLVLSNASSSFNPTLFKRVSPPGFTVSLSISSWNWCIYQGLFKCYVTLFPGNFTPHPHPRNASNVEPYTFVKLFFRENRQPPTRHGVTSNT